MQCRPTTKEILLHEPTVTRQQNEDVRVKVAQSTCCCVSAKEPFCARRLAIAKRQVYRTARGPASAGRSALSL